MRQPDETPAFAIVDATSPRAQVAMGRYVEELLGVLPHGFTAEEAIAVGATAYNPPHGLFVVAGDPDPVAGGAITFLDAQRAEVKRMWVAPTARGTGLATALLHRLEERAREAGRHRMVLDTNSALRAAVRLYEREGYVRVPAYNDNPDADVWFAKDLAH